MPLVEGWIKELGPSYPRISVENEVTDCPPLQQKQVAQSVAGTPPNVLMVKSDNTAFYAEQQLLRPIDDLMRRDGVKADWFYPGEFRSRTWQGKAYGLPNVTAGSLHLLFVNTRLLQRVGWDPQKPVGTWQDLEALVEPARREGLFVMDPAKVSTGQTMHFVLTYANGGRLLGRRPDPDHLEPGPRRGGGRVAGAVHQDPGRAVRAPGRRRRPQERQPLLAGRDQRPRRRNQRPHLHGAPPARPAVVRRWRTP